MTKIYAKAFKGLMNFGEKKWWIGVGEEEDPSMNEWLTPKEARSLYNQLGRALELVDKQKEKVCKEK